MTARLARRLLCAANRLDDRGAAVVEMAIAAPVLLMLLLGITAYGGYFWLAHSVQQAANEAARSALAGLDTTERRSLAEEAADEQLDRVAALDPQRASVIIEDDGTLFVVRLRYDASDSSFLRLGLVPMPEPVIERSGAVRIAGL